MYKRSDSIDIDVLHDKLIGKQEQSSLQDSLRQLEICRTMLDQTSDAIFLVHVQSKKLVDVNQSACLQLECSREELLSMSIDSFFQFPPKNSLTEDLLSEINNNKVETLNAELLKPNGDLLTVEVTIRPVTINNTEYLVMVAHDISERLQAEKNTRAQYQQLLAAYEELNASYEEIEALSGEVEASYNVLIESNLELTSVKERLELALWGTEAGMWDWHIQTGKLFFNERYAEIHGFKPNELPKRLYGWENRVIPEDWAYVKANLYAHIDGKTPFYEVEYRVKNKNGETIWIQDSGKVVSRDKNGQAERAVGTTREITRRKETELALGDAMAKYQGIVNAINNPVFLLDSEEIIILEANPAAQNLFGYTAAELKNLDFTILNSLESEKAGGILKEYVAKAYQNGSHTDRGMGKKKNGDIFPLQIHISIISVNDEDRILAVITDSTEEVLFHREQEKTAHYEAQAMKMTAISAVSAGVVHEISQPLNALKVLADGILYRHELGRNIDMVEVFDTFKKISRQAERINEIIRHMRNLASSAEDSINTTSDINVAITETMKILGRQLMLHDIQVELDLDKGISPVLGPQEQLENIVINLTINAMHALNEQWQQTKRISCLTRQKDDTVIMEIADNGPGISPEIGEQIWEPFYSTRKGGKGMGLGLAIIQSILSRQGGNITYYNNKWGGTTFRVLFSTLPNNPPRPLKA